MCKRFILKNGTIKYISIFLSIITVLASVSFSFVTKASAATSTGKITCFGADFDDETYEKVTQSLINREEAIDIRELNLTPDKAGDLLQSALFKNPRLFYVDNTRFVYSSYNGRVISIIPEYIFGEEECVQMTQEFDKKVQSILSKLDFGMSDFAKAAVLHDEIILNCEYKIRNSEGRALITAYDSLVGGQANCEGYSLGYSYLLSLAGIDSEIVQSETMVHAWNKVKIGSSYYNVDVTFDDPVPDKPGNVVHTYFLLSDEAIGSEEGKHYGFDDICNKSTDKSYDNAYFKELNSRFCFDDTGAFYAIDNSCQGTMERKLINYNISENTYKTVKDFDYLWPAEGNGYYWTNGFIGLDMYNDVLYYNSSDAVFAFNPKTNRTESVEPVAATESKLYGLVIRGGDIYCGVGSSPNDELVLKKVAEVPDYAEPTEPTTEPSTAEPTEPTTEPTEATTEPSTAKPTEATEPSTGSDTVAGDADGNGVLNIKDITEMQKHIAMLVELPAERVAASDFNSDGKLDIIDCTSWQRKLAGVA